LAVVGIEALLYRKEDRGKREKTAMILLTPEEKQINGTGTRSDERGSGGTERKA
jgi:hypothetical protein